MMRSRCGVLAAALLLLIVAVPARACEPVVPFIQTVAPILALSWSIFMLAGAVTIKSLLFVLFERRLPRARAAWLMFLGNLLTSFVGLLVAAMIGSGPIWFIGVPVVYVLCWLPSRRLVTVAPLAWLSRLSRAGVSGIMTIALLASCILFAVGRGAIESHQLGLYWILKLVAIFLALLASVSLTTIWEEWVVWRLSSRPDGVGYFGSVLRTNLYVLIVVMAVPAAVLLPQRLKSPDFLARHSTVTHTTAQSR